MTSHDVVEVVRRKLGQRRVGHAGTLDPMAEGLLVLLLGPATKQQQRLQGHDKTYVAELRLGTQTDSGDATGKPVREAPVPPLESARVAGVLASLEGPHEQTPPAYSAVKVRGRPAYWWARRQETVSLSPRTVELAELSLLECRPERIVFRVSCSSGTYVRTLGETIAGRLGTVGHLSKLTRTRVGDWRLEQARPLSWVQQVDPPTVAAAVIPVTDRAP
jgi:tRNA pseudouridine55 synthase